MISSLSKLRFLGLLLSAGAICVSLITQAPAQSILISSNDTWRYLDVGADMGISLWRSVNFTEDYRWKTGTPPLGYGATPDGQPLSTTIGYGPDPTNKYVTTYFRHLFVVTNAAAISNLTVTVESLNGAVVYLNFFEVYRDFMPSGPVQFNTLALPAEAPEHPEEPFLSRTVNGKLLNEGTNVVAVEIHQSGVTNANLSFELRLVAHYAETASTIPSLKRGPYLQIGTPTSMTIRWRTDLATDSRVDYGLDPSNLTESSSDDAVTTEHVVTLAELLPDTRYYYSVGASQTNFASGPDYFFVTSTATNRPTRIWVIGDSGTATLPGGNAEGVRDAYYNFAAGRHTDLWLMLGDNAYYEGTDDQYQTAVFNTYPELLRHTAVWTTIGNHETYDPYPDGHIAYSDIFSMPTKGEAGGVPSGTERYYSFDFGNIHFVCLDSEISSHATNGPMLTWLLEDLAANTNDWLVAFWHSPPYSHGSHDSDDPGEDNLIGMRQNVVPILEAYGVDLVLCGHSHSYERSFLLDGHYGFSDTLMPSMIVDAGSGQPSDTGAYIKSMMGPAPHQGAVYVVNGSSGWAIPGVNPVQHSAMYKSLLETGSVVLDVDQNRLEGKFLRETGAINDSFTILKGVPAEQLRLANLRFSTNTVCAKWKSIAGKQYRLQWTTSFLFGPWHDVSDTVAATGATTSWQGPVPSTSGSGFYRIIEVTH